MRGVAWRGNLRWLEGVGRCQGAAFCFSGPWKADGVPLSIHSGGLAINVPGWRYALALV